MFFLVSCDFQFHILSISCPFALSFSCSFHGHFLCTCRVHFLFNSYQCHFHFHTSRSFHAHFILFSLRVHVLHVLCHCQFHFLFSAFHVHCKFMPFLYVLHLYLQFMSCDSSHVSISSHLVLFHFSYSFSFFHIRSYTFSFLLIHSILDSFVRIFIQPISRRLLHSIIHVFLVSQSISSFTLAFNPKTFLWAFDVLLFLKLPP